MIGKLTGYLDYIGDDYIILDVMGVGYLVYVLRSSLVRLENNRDKVSFTIQTNVKEDGIYLYGFLSLQEKFWFNELCKVSGIGAKIAMNVLSSIEIDSIENAIIMKNTDIFESISGIGPKVANRIINEMQSSIKKLSAIDKVSNSHSNVKKSDGIFDKDMAREVCVALTRLGFSQNEIYPIVVSKIKANPGLSVENIIGETLKEFGGRV